MADRPTAATWKPVEGATCLACLKGKLVPKKLPKMDVLACDTCTWRFLVRSDKGDELKNRWKDTRPT